MDPDTLDRAVITDGVSPGTEIIGWLIADKSSWRIDPDSPASDPRPVNRWSHQRVWKLESGGYVVARLAYSLIYHRASTHCMTATGDQQGVRMTRAEMMELVTAMGYGLDDLVSCPKCEPPFPERLKDGSVIRYEKVRVTIDQCETSAALTRRLTVKKRKGGVVTTTVPETTRLLLMECARKDPDWDSTGPVVVIR